MCSTNLSVKFVESLGIDTNRIAIAADRAVMKSKQRRDSDAAWTKYFAAVEAQKRAATQAERARNAAEAERLRAWLMSQPPPPRPIVIRQETQGERWQRSGLVFP